MGKIKTTTNQGCLEQSEVRHEYFITHEVKHEMDELNRCIVDL